jgi:hypothetical protein
MRYGPDPPVKDARSMHELSTNIRANLADLGVQEQFAPPPLSATCAHSYPPINPISANSRNFMIVFSGRQRCAYRSPNRTRPLIGRLKTVRCLLPCAAWRRKQVQGLAGQASSLNGQFYTLLLLFGTGVGGIAAIMA